MQTLIVYRGHDNTVQDDLVRYDTTLRKYVPISFAGVTRMVLTLVEADPVITFDTDELPGTIVWTAAGHLTFHISEYDIPVGVYTGRLIAYSPMSPNGQVIVDGDPVNGRQLSFEVRGFSPDGIPPPVTPTGGIILTRTSGMVFSALRVLYESQGAVFTISPESPSAPVDQIIGIGLTASGTIGAEVAIRAAGTIDDPSWTWSEGNVYLGTDGTLTQTYPVEGWEVVVGFAPSATRLNINFDEPVLLA